MTRVKRRAPTKGKLGDKQRDEKKCIPRLIDILPTNGFRWHTQCGNPFLSHAMSQKIVAAWRPYIEISRKELVAKQMTKMFDNACKAVVRGDVPDEPAVFWQNVASSIPWMRKISGETLQLFALKILSARITFRSVITHHKRKNEKEKVDKLAVATALIQAVERYIVLLPVAYSFWFDVEPDYDTALAELLAHVVERITMP